MIPTHSDFFRVSLSANTACAVKKYLNAIFDQYHRLKFKNRMFSLRNDLLSQFCVLFANSSLAANDFVDNSIPLDIKQSNVKNSFVFFLSLSKSRSMSF